VVSGIALFPRVDAFLTENIWMMHQEFKQSKLIEWLFLKLTSIFTNDIRAFHLYASERLERVILGAMLQPQSFCFDLR